MATCGQIFGRRAVLRILLLLAVVAVWTAAAPRALADAGSISNVHPVGSQLEATVSVSHDTCDAFGYCGWFPEVYDVEPGQPCTTGESIAWVGSYQSTTGSQSMTFDFYPNFAGNGDHLCLYVDAGSSTTLISETSWTPPPPPPVPTRHTERVPAWIGHQADRYHYNYASFNDTLVPGYLDASRVQEVVTRSASRWGISINGGTTASPDDQDYQNTIGFSDTLPEGVLGETDIYTRRVYVPGIRRCRTARRYGRRVRVCRRGPRRLVGTQVVEEDIGINDQVPWNDGPFYPDTSHFDFESTMLHELGHFAGNPHHVYGCVDSPLIDAASPGDWWHAPDDWARAGCSAADGRGPSARVRAVFLTRYVDVTAAGHVPRHRFPAVDGR